MGRERPLWEGSYAVLDHIGDFIRIGYDYLPRFFGGKVVKFSEHLARGAEIQPRHAVGIGEFHTRLQYLAINLVVFFGEVRVTGRDDRLAQLFAERDDAPVERDQPFPAFDLAFVNEIAVVAQRLDL